MGRLNFSSESRSEIYGLGKAVVKLLDGEIQLKWTTYLFNLLFTFSCLMQEKGTLTYLKEDGTISSKYTNVGFYKPLVFNPLVCVESDLHVRS